MSSLSAEGAACVIAVGNFVSERSRRDRRASSARVVWLIQFHANSPPDADWEIEFAGRERSRSGRRIGRFQTAACVETPGGSVTEALDDGDLLMGGLYAVKRFDMVQMR